MKNLDNNLLQAYYIAVMLGINVELYEIDEKNNVLINTYLKWLWAISEKRFLKQ